MRKERYKDQEGKKTLCLGDGERLWCGGAGAKDGEGWREGGGRDGGQVWTVGPSSHSQDFSPSVLVLHRLKTDLLVTQLVFTESPPKAGSVCHPLRCFSSRPAAQGIPFTSASGRVSSLAWAVLELG